MIEGDVGNYCHSRRYLYKLYLHLGVDINTRLEATSLALARLLKERPVMKPDSLYLLTNVLHANFLYSETSKHRKVKSYRIDYCQSLCTYSRRRRTSVPTNS